MYQQKALASLIMPVVVFAFCYASATAAPPAEKRVLWYKNLYTAHQQALATKKPMMLVFGADWCTYCKKLDKETLGDPRMAEFVNHSFVPVQLDLERDQRIAKILEVDRVPCTVILTPDADLLGRLIGYADVNAYYTHLQKARRVQSEVQTAKHEKINRPIR